MSKRKETLHIYIRCSTDKQIEKSVDRQKKMGIEFSKQQGMKHKLWIDGGKSRFGGLEKRKEISELMVDIEMGSVKHLWIEEWSRLTGEINDTFEIETKILNDDLTIYEGLRGNQPYRPNNVMERMFQYMKTMMGSEVKKDEIKKSIQTKIDLFNQGYYMLGQPPFGYKIVDRKLVKHPENSKWVKKIFEWYVVDKMSMGQICDELVLNNIPTPRSKTRKWDYPNIKIILENENYIGRMIYTDKTKDPHRKDQKRFPFEDRSKWIVYENECPRIVSDEIWNGVDKLLDRGKTRPTKRNYLLHGKLECLCGMEWVGRWYSKYDRPFYMCKNNERRYYRNTPSRSHLHQKNCSKPKRINGEVLDKYIWNNLLSTLRKSSWIKERVKKEILGERYGISSIRKNLNREIKLVRKEIKTFQQNRVEFIKDRYVNNLTELDYNQIISSIDDKITEKEHELDRLKNKELLMDKREEWIDWLNHHNKNVDDYLKITEMKERRRVVDFYIDKISVDWNDTTKQHTINIHYKYPIIGDGLVRKGGKLNWDEWGKGYKVKQGERVYSLSSSNFFLTQENYHSLLNSHELLYDVWKPYLVFEYIITTHNFNPTMYRYTDVSHRLKLHTEINKLHEQGWGYTKIHTHLIKNGFKIGKSRTMRRDGNCRWSCILFIFTTPINQK